MIQLRYIYFLCSVLLLSFIAAGCGKRKPKVLTVPQKLETKANVSVGVRACNWSDYSTFLGANRIYFPFDSKLVQIYIKNDSQNRYKFSSKNIRRMSPEYFAVFYKTSRKIDYLRSGQFVSAAILSLPLAWTLGFGIVYGMMTLAEGSSNFLGVAIVGTFIIFPAVVIGGCIGLSVYASRCFNRIAQKQKANMADRLKKNLLSSNFCFDLEPQSEMHKVFFVSNKDFKDLQKHGILLSLTDQQTQEKLVFSVSLS